MGKEPDWFVDRMMDMQEEAQDEAADDSATMQALSEVCQGIARGRFWGSPQELLTQNGVVSDVSALLCGNDDLGFCPIVSAIPVDDDGRVKVQTVLMSATMDRAMIEQFFHVDEWVEIDVQKHNNSVVRQANAPSSKAALL